MENDKILCYSSITDRETEISDVHRRQYVDVECPLESRRIVSGSEAFKKFLRNNRSLLPLPSTSTNQ